MERKKSFYVHFVYQKGSCKRCECLKYETLKRDIDSLICAAQEQVIQTNAIRGKTEKSQKETKCSMCGKADEAINHIVIECTKLTQKEYKRRCLD